MAKLTERTSFTKDVEGRYLCNLEPADLRDFAGRWWKCHDTERSGARATVGSDSDRSLHG